MQHVFRAEVCKIKKLSNSKHCLDQVKDAEWKSTRTKKDETSEHMPSGFTSQFYYKQNVNKHDGSEETFFRE